MPPSWARCAGARRCGPSAAVVPVPATAPTGSSSTPRGGARDAGRGGAEPASSGLVLQIDSARVLSHPAATLRAAERARRDGWTVAVRGVGASWRRSPCCRCSIPQIVPVGCQRPAALRAAPISEVFEAVRGHRPMRQHRHGRRCHVPWTRTRSACWARTLAAGPRYLGRGEHAGEVAAVSHMLGQRTRGAAGGALQPVPPSPSPGRRRGGSRTSAPSSPSARRSSARRSPPVARR